MKHRTGHDESRNQQLPYTLEIAESARELFKVAGTLRVPWLLFLIDFNQKREELRRTECAYYRRMPS